MEALDNLAPVMTRTVLVSTSAPCYTVDLRLLKAQGRHLECLFSKTGVMVHKDMYADHIQVYKNALSITKTEYYANIMMSGEENILFSNLNSFLKPPDILPCDMYSTEHCNNFMNFLNWKIGQKGADPSNLNNFWPISNPGL